jgi:S-adenosylmethionine synthetase
MTTPRAAHDSNDARYLFTSESVTEGHPDKVCDYIADSILDAYLEKDPQSRVACEVLCKEGFVVIAGEFTSNAKVGHEAVARRAIREIGYIDPAVPFNADGVQVHQYVMPLPIILAHALSRGLAEDRHNGNCPWLRPDGKTQVSVLYEDNMPMAVTDAIVSPQHSASVSRDEIVSYVSESLAPRVLGNWYDKKIRFHVNPTGSFVHGGPSADAGVTGRKIIVDTYGGAGRHGGGAFSGKDPSKVDRSGAYFCRYIARQIVKQKMAHKAEIQISYAIGVSRPLSVKVDTFGTGNPVAAAEYIKTLDFRPAAIIERFNLLRPIYRQTTNYGHFGKAGMPWEE